MVGVTDCNGVTVTDQPSDCGELVSGLVVPLVVIFVQGGR